MITYFKDKSNKSKKKYKIYKTLNTILESVDTIIFIEATSFFLFFRLLVLVRFFLPISAGIACTLSLGNQILHKIIINNCNKYIKQYEKDQKTNKSFDKLYGQCLQDNVIERNEYESLCYIFTKYLEEAKTESFF